MLGSKHQNRIPVQPCHCASVNSGQTLPDVSELAQCALHPAHRYAYERLIALRLRWIRLSLLKMFGDAYSQRNVCSALGRSQTWLSNIENAHRRLDVNELRTLAALYGFPAPAILTEPTGIAELGEYDLFVSEWYDANPERPRPPVLPDLGAMDTEPMHAIDIDRKPP
jgi:hypothetical protein